MREDGRVITYLPVLFNVRWVSKKLNMAIEVGNWVQTTVNCDHIEVRSR